MSARYGDRTRSGDAVSQGGRRVVVSAGGGAQSMYEETFTAPGTWTWPGNVTHVEVLLVGGGGGSGAQAAPPAPAGYAGSGGGGGVRMVYDIPVTGPVPVTVGSGGAGGTYPGGHGSAGGDSAFGPISPPIPPSTYKVGGGGGGAAGSGPNPLPVGTTVTDAPTDGGGGGGGGSSTYVSPLPPPFSPITLSVGAGQGGEYGVPAFGLLAPTPSNIFRDSGKSGGSLTSPMFSMGGLGKWGYGSGVHREPDYLILGQGSNNNTGTGARGSTTGTSPGSSGYSGIVIVRWWE